MTDFAVQCATTPMLSPFVSSDKGDIANRIQCSAEHTKNCVSTTAKFATIGGLSGLGMYLGLIKFPKVAEVINKGLTKILNLLPDKKVLNAIKNASPKAKLAAAILVPTVTCISYVLGKGIYKSGQIDQKYTDAAKIESREKNYLL